MLFPVPSSEDRQAPAGALLPAPSARPLLRSTALVPVVGAGEWRLNRAGHQQLAPLGPTSGCPAGC